ncbi:DUF1573 domain-containing protein [Dysgonomonas sp. 216]|uniref:DUF1573 domain-containing protein n=1 Tax=Dysgonomonas sp. 216 TaxID=2302934 RepID=UPI0013D76031|nr:DUF1573 domain-containing protein [Dysgonomonas sp. 216]NDW18082.1 DUF1573 domain-containing protein [Dysgonomonas sp. 216]
MKKLGVFLMMAIFSVSFAVAQTAEAPKAEFKEKTHNFGKIAEELGKASFSFEFTNTGNAPLIINSVRATCGCTTPSYSKEPVLPGKKGEVTVAYSTTGRVGAFDKTITVFTNVPDTTFRLNIKGEVLPRK